MKKITFILLFGGITAFAQQKPTPQTTITPQPVATQSVSSNAPEITFIETTHDFGTVKKGSPIVFQFKYKNTGKEPLIVFDCKAGCHCTTPKCSKEPVKSGKTGFIEVHFDSMRAGTFAKEIMITSNAKNGIVNLIIKGNVAGEAEGTDAIVPAKEKSPIEKKSE